MFSHDDKTIFYQQNNRFYAMDAQTLETHCFYETPEGWSGSAPGMSSDNRFMSIVETKQDTLPPRDGSAGWNFFALTCEAKPLCRIVYIDVETVGLVIHRFVQMIQIRFYFVMKDLMI